MSILNQTFDQVFVINLDRRKDRREHFQKELSRLSISYNRISAVDGESEDVPNVDGLTPGEVGCILSHKKVLERVIKEKIQLPLILEDDIIFEDKFNSRFKSHFSQLPEDWSMYYPAANTTQDENLTPVTKNIDRTYKALTTHSYSVKLEKAEKLYQIIEDNAFEKPVDDTYTHFQKEEKVYVSSPNLIIQKEGHSNVRGGFRNYFDVLKDIG